MTPKPPTIRYKILSLACWYCNKENHNIRYAPAAGVRFFRCEFCKRRNVVVVRFVAIRPEDEDGD